MIDKVFAGVSLMAVVAFMAVVTFGVMEPDLWIVTLIVLVIAVVYFWQDLRAGGSQPEGQVQEDPPRR